ncbi:MFS transporter [Pseudonocardia sp.]|uniref:MFS transporter n=1 Tax=Pseudonocardia sp. TaxID=60912 RepID=UPI003D11ABAC
MPTAHPAPSILRLRDFRWYLVGVGLSQAGSNGALAAMLYHVYVLSGSTFQVGVVGAARGATIIACSPWAGHLADRFDRRRLLQLSQAGGLVVALALAVVTLLGVVASWQIWAAMVLISIAAAVDQPARKALIPALVPRGSLMQAITMTNPVNQVARLVGPALGGVLIAVRGPELMYLLDALICLVLIVIFLTIRTPPPDAAGPRSRFWPGLVEGVRFVARRPIIYQLGGLDVAAQLFTAYRVVLPMIALDVLQAGPIGYGVLSAAVPAGGLVGGLVAYRTARVPFRAGVLALLTTAGYGAAAVVLGLGTVFAVALGGALCLGLFDAVATAFRQSVVIIETPDAMQGRVQSLYQMSATGAPAVGEFNVGVIAGLVGPTAALVGGGLACIGYVALVAWRAPVVRRYRTHTVAVEPSTDERRRTP